MRFSWSHPSQFPSLPPSSSPSKMMTEDWRLRMTFNFWRTLHEMSIVEHQVSSLDMTLDAGTRVFTPRRRRKHIFFGMVMIRIIWIQQAVVRHRRSLFLVSPSEPDQSQSMDGGPPMNELSHHHSHRLLSCATKWEIARRGRTLSCCRGRYS